MIQEVTCTCKAFCSSLAMELSNASSVFVSSLHACKVQASATSHTHPLHATTQTILLFAPHRQHLLVSGKLPVKAIDKPFEMMVLKATHTW